MDWTTNVTDTAIVFEGGGMRGSFTAGIVTTLLQAGIFADYVVGISAGSSNTVNYVVRDADRNRKCFVDFADDPHFGSWRTWLRGKGVFNSQYIYEESPLPGGPLPFDYDSFMNSPTQFHIGAFDAAAGETVYWSRSDIHDMGDLMRKVRASSSIPIAMPAVKIAGRTYVDGALGADGGIPLGQAKRDGYSKFFVVLTRERDYIKPPASATGLLKTYYRKYPAIADGIIARAHEYNAVREELFELERQGQACLVLPDQMTVTNQTRNVPKLQAMYDAARAQGERELPHWKEFFGLE